MLGTLTTEFLHFPDDVRMPVWRDTDREFFVTPLLLGDVQGDQLLGFRTDVQQQSITLHFPVHLSSYRSTISANSCRFVQAGFRTRVILICRLTRPRSLIPAQIEDLLSIYAQRGVPRSVLLPTLSQLLKRFKIITPPAA